MSRIQDLMLRIQSTCQEICDIKNPLHSHKTKIINKVYSRPPGPSHDNSREHLQDKYGENGWGGNNSFYNTPTPPLDQWCNLCTNQGDGEHCTLLPPSPIPTCQGHSTLNNP